MEYEYKINVSDVLFEPMAIGNWQPILPFRWLMLSRQSWRVTSITVIKKK